MKIIDYLEHWALSTPDRVFAIQSDGVQMSYSQFWSHVCDRAMEYAQDKHAGECVVLRTTQTIDYLISYFACHRAGLIVVPLEHNIPEEKKTEIISLVEDKVFPSEASDILFTTGTTGVPKGVVLSHEALMTDAKNLTQAHGYHAELTFIINGPLNHFGSHSKVLPVVMMGATLFLMDGMKTMDDFYNAIDSIHGNVATFLVPASIRMLMQFSATRLRSYSSRIEFIETGAAPITQTDMKALSDLLPDSRLYNTYAGSEVGVVCTYNFNDGQSLPSCVGQSFPLSHFELKNEVVVCSGKGLMMGYLGQPLVPCVPEIETSDLGRVDEEGRLYLIGRQSDLINVGGLKVSPHEVEEVATAIISGLKDCICIAIPHPLMGYVPKLLVVMQEGYELDKKAVAKRMKGQLESYKVPVNIECVDHIERTYNGKINRKFYNT